MVAPGSPLRLLRGKGVAGVCFRLRLSAASGFRRRFAAKVPAWLVLAGVISF